MSALSTMTTMRPWWIKAGIQGTLSLLPEPQRWNRLFQRYVTQSIHLREPTFRRKWEQTLRHYQNWGSYRREPPTSVLELGTGWHPVVPCGLALLGVEQVHTLDVSSLVSPRTLAETIGFYAMLLDELPEELPIDPHRATIIREFHRRSPSDPGEALARLGVRTLVADARRSGLDAGSIDLFVSNNTLEHLTPMAIATVFQEFGRLAAPGSLMSHFIDMADHYASFDSSISIYNFLRFPEVTWRVFNNGLQYQNRLRVSDFRNLHRGAGWCLLDEYNVADAEAFARARLAPQFRRYSREDCMVYASWITSERARS